MNQNNNYFLIKRTDAKRYLPPELQQQLEAIEKAINHQREKDNKGPLPYSCADSIYSEWMGTHQQTQLNNDANRYRYLRRQDLDTIYQGGIFAGRTPQNLALNGDDLDQAIDGAIFEQSINKREA